MLVKTSSITFRRAAAADYPAILRLQSAAYIANISKEDRREGFLSAMFTLEQVSAVAEDLGTMLAIVEGHVAGFLCASRGEFNRQLPVPAKMLECYDHMRFEGKPLSSFTSYLYGPVSLDREYRRRGLLRGLYEAQKRDLAGRFEIGVAFVSRSNPHSLQAHVTGLGMKEVGDFEVQGNAYVILAFRLPPG